MSEGQQTAAQVIQALEDQMRLLRDEIQNLRRSSLNKDEADALNKRIATALVSMEQKVGKTESDIKQYSQAIIQLNKEATGTAVREEMQDMRNEIKKAAADYSKAAGEARKQAWQYFGGFWVWLISMLLLGLVIGFAGSSWVRGNSAAKDFGKYPSVYCESAGGTKTTNSDRKEICVFWLE